MRRPPTMALDRGRVVVWRNSARHVTIDGGRVAFTIAHMGDGISAKVTSPPRLIAPPLAVALPSRISEVQNRQAVVDKAHAADAFERGILPLEARRSAPRRAKSSARTFATSPLPGQGRGRKVATVFLSVDRRTEISTGRHE